MMANFLYFVSELIAGITYLVWGDFLTNLPVLERFNKKLQNLKLLNYLIPFLLDIILGSPSSLLELPIICPSKITVFLKLSETDDVSRRQISRNFHAK